MKRILLIFSLLATFSVSSFARMGHSILDLRLSTNQSILVYLNGYNLGANSAHVQIRDLPAGTHHIQVFALQNSMYGPEYFPVFQGQITIQPDRHIYATIYPRFGLRVEREIPLGRSWNPRWSAPPSEFDYDLFWNGQCQNTPSPIQPAQPVITAMDEGSFSQFLQTLRNTSFESTRMSVLNSVLNNRYFTTDQVIRILRQFSFESSKLEAAKSLYARTVDPLNYFRVYDVFSFSSSVQQLSDFIATR